MIDSAHTPIDKWSLTFVGDELGADGSHVWRASLDQPADMIAKLSSLLSQDEYQRAERFQRPTDRRRFIAGRGILRKIISAYLSLTPAEARFAYNKYGNPFISDDQNCGALSFNLSHSSGVVLYAAARGRRVGIDVESMPLDGFTVSLAPDVAPALLKVDADATEATRRKMYELDVARGYAAALIVENPPVTLSQFQWNE
jgi:FAD/FMN-containing dehydrogenase